MKERSISSDLAGYLPISYVPTPQSDPLDVLLKQKTAQLKARAELLLDQIDKRNELHQNSMSAIDRQECGICSKITMIDSALGKGLLDSIVLQRKQSLELELHQLHKERRDLNHCLWSDLLKLYQDLLDAMQEFQRALADERLVGGEDGQG